MKAAMRSAKQSLGAYGAASAVFSGVIACVFVTGASIFGDALDAAIGDWTCNASPGCAAPVVAGAVPPTIDPPEQLSAESALLDEPPTDLPTTAMRTAR